MYVSCIHKSTSQELENANIAKKSGGAKITSSQTSVKLYTNQSLSRISKPLYLEPKPPKESAPQMFVIMSYSTEKLCANSSTVQ